MLCCASRGVAGHRHCRDSYARVVVLGTPGMCLQQVTLFGCLMPAKRKRESAPSAGSDPLEEEGDDGGIWLDEHGRIDATSDCGLDFDFTACDITSFIHKPGTKAVTSKIIAEDLNEMFNMAQGQTTFWLPVTQEPRCTVERLARCIFNHHTRSAPLPLPGGSHRGRVSYSTSSKWVACFVCQHPRSKRPPGVW